MNSSFVHASFKVAAVSATLLLAPALARAAEGTFDRTLNVSGSTYLYVDTGSGNIHVTPGSDNRVHIVGHVKASNSGWNWNSANEGSPEERVKKVVGNPPIQQEGSTIRVGKLHEVHNVSIDYEITTPAGTKLEADSGSGDIRIRQITGGVVANTGSGNIEAAQIGGYVSLETGSGDIHSDVANSGEVKAHTGSGNVRLDNVQGALKADTGSGNIDVSGHPSSPWKLEAGSGNLTLNTGNAHYSLDAETGSGSLHTDPPMTTHGTQEHHHISGDINGGGPMVRLETGSGDITIH